MMTNELMRFDFDRRRGGNSAPHDRLCSAADRRQPGGRGHRGEPGARGSAHQEDVSRGQEVNISRKKNIFRLGIVFFALQVPPYDHGRLRGCQWFTGRRRPFPGAALAGVHLAQVHEKAVPLLGEEACVCTKLNYKFWNQLRSLKGDI